MSENNANHQNAFDVDVSFTRPANVTPYVVGQAISTVVGEALEFKIVGSNGGEIVFVNELIVLSSNPLSGLDFSCALFSIQPANVADGVAIPNFNNCVAIPEVLNSVPSVADTFYQFERINRTMKLAENGTSIYAIFRANSSYTPISGETFKATIKGYRVR